MSENIGKPTTGKVAPVGKESQRPTPNEIRHTMGALL